jgi:hypothetical protein
MRTITTGHGEDMDLGPPFNGLLGKPAVFRTANRDTSGLPQIWAEIGLSAGSAAQPCKQRFLPDETS